jgi:hypothetical protein
MHAGVSGLFCLCGGQDAGGAVRGEGGEKRGEIFLICAYFAIASRVL